MELHAAHRGKVLLVVIPLGMALNLAPGLAAQAWHLPLFLDAFGTIAFTILCGWRVGAAIGVLSAFAGGLLNPHMPWFAGTHLVIALTTAVCAHHGGFRSFPRIVATGLIVGVLAALVSAPAAALAFGDPGELTESPLGAILSGAGNHLQLAFSSAKTSGLSPPTKSSNASAPGSSSALCPSACGDGWRHREVS